MDERLIKLLENAYAARDGNYSDRVDFVHSAAELAVALGIEDPNTFEASDDEV